MEKKSVTVIVLSVALVIALGVIIYLASTSSQAQIAKLNSQLNMEKLIINRSADIFDSRLHDLLQEHTFLLIYTTRNISAPQFNASLTQLQTNINEVGTLLTPLPGYGAVNASQLVNLWNKKAQIFINYSSEVSSGNPNAVSDFNTAATAYERQVAQFWSDTTNAYPYLDYNFALQLSTRNINDVKLAIDYWNAGNYASFYPALENAYNDQGNYADIIANAIIQQNGQYFLNLDQQAQSS